MFWNKKADPSPQGVHLGQLQAMLSPTTIKTSLKKNCLLAQHEHYTVRIEVAPPKAKQSPNGPIRAVVRLITELPAPLQKIFAADQDTTVATFNSFASLNALYTDGGKVVAGSRLTVYEEEDAWSSLHLPLLLFTTISGVEPIFGALRRTFGQEESRGGESDWGQEDLDQIESVLSRISVCTTGDLGLTAEFPLGSGAVSAAHGDRQTALYQVMADQPHPEAGGGLFCLLQMPHQVADEEKLRKVCAQLNSMEMAEDDLVPHFGAWCVGKLGNNPAYVSFLPNVLHRVSGIAVNNAVWAMNRAIWANEKLASMGITA
jgi:hypothetical protein